LQFLTKELGEKKMKIVHKLLTLVLTLIMVIGLAVGCAPATPADPPAADPPVTEPPAAELPEEPPDAPPDAPATEPAADSVPHVDIVVIGGGGAGMVAALQARQNGAENIVVIEQMPMLGGNTMLATGRMQAAGSRYQDPEDGDSVELYIYDIMRGGGHIADEDLVRVMAENSAQAVYWLNDNFNTNITDIGRGGGASAPRSHGPVNEAGAVLPIGSVLAPALVAGLSEANIPVLLNTEATEILTDADGAVTGVVVRYRGEDFTINASAVILTTGGFGANPQMVERYDPSLRGFGTSNHVGATGSGIELARNIGAGLVHMEHIQAHPTGHPGGTLLTEAMRGEGSILINLDGERFVDELSTRDVVSEAILAQPQSTSYMIFDARIRGRLAIIETYISAGIVVQADSLSELAEKLGIDTDTFVASLERYNYYAAQEQEPDFNRTAPFVLEGDSFYAVATIPVIHHTMGGVTINTDSRVLNEAGEIIPNLFAAGEVVGGIHGNNRLGGNAVTELTVFGRIAAQQAVEHVRATAGLTAPADLTVITARRDADDAPDAQGNFEDGVFVGTGRGYGGDLSVRVTVQNGNIVDAYIFDHSETPIIYTAAETGVISEIIRTQSTDVDTVAGATLTSLGIIEAVNDALGR
jgi:fumarate reductase flavoprotein subunit